MKEASTKSKALYLLLSTKHFSVGSLRVPIVPPKFRRLVRRESINKGFTGRIGDIKAGFAISHVAVFESSKEVELEVELNQSYPIGQVVISWCTISGTAREHKDFIPVRQGKLIFEAREKRKHIKVQNIDDNVYEKDKFFTVQLSSPELQPDNQLLAKYKFYDDINYNIAMADNRAKCMVTIVDDDDNGEFTFTQPKIQVSESRELLRLPVERQKGVRSRVRIPFTVTEKTAKIGQHFKVFDNDHDDFTNNLTGNLSFSDEQQSKNILIEIVDEAKLDKDVEFEVSLGEPEVLLTEEETRQMEQLSISGEQYAIQGKPRLGTNSTITVNIKESADLKDAVEKFIKAGGLIPSIVVGTSTWQQQFQAAAKLPEEKSLLNYVVHFLVLPWKLLFAFVPPTDYFGGWLAFVCSLGVIGFLTALVGDMAGQLGCYIRLKDSVMAITFVALGTSMPDAFASKIAAQQDKHADASIGNVNGSNAVNVFLGIGIAWIIASVYHACNDSIFYVPPGGIALSVSLYLLLSVVASCVLLVRRFVLGAELGGPSAWKYLSGGLFVLMWLVYVIVSSLDAYGVINLSDLF